MRVKTSGAALMTAAILAAVLSWVCVGDGKVSVEAPPAPAVHFEPLKPNADLPTFSKVTVPPAASDQKEATHISTPLPTDKSIAEPKPSIDAFALEGLRGALTYVVLFTLLHFGLRRRDVSGRWAYAGIGAVSALFCAASQVPVSGWSVLQAGGRISVMLGFPLVAGAIMGFLYQWRAGLEAAGDDPKLLSLALQKDPADGPGTASPDRAYVDTGAAQYFSGPLQVRTTAPVAFIASLITGGVFAFAKAIFTVQSELPLRFQQNSSPSLNVLANAFAGQALQEFLTYGLFAPILFTAVVLIGHGVLRGINRTSILAYLITGALSPLLLLLALGPLGLLLGLQAVVPLAAAMALYRNMAGLEPKRVKEDILFADTRDLVGEHHARRTFGRLVKR